MSCLRIGLTGGLASGKSTVASWLGEAGYRVVDADRLVAELYRPGEAGTAAVRELLGPEMLAPSGAVDAPKLAARIFADPEARRRLEEAVHPLVRRRFQELADREPGPIVLEATLLAEAGYARDFDFVVTVEADPEIRVARAVRRGMDEEAARARLAAQDDGTLRRRLAHRILWNNGSLQDLREETGALLAELEELRKARGCSQAARAEG